jgi:hypothetical protein
MNDEPVDPTFDEVTEPTEDNIEAAMEAVAATTKPARKSNTGAKKGESAQSQILIRATPEDHELIKRAAAHVGISMSEFIRKTAVDKAAELVECSHPQTHRKAYPWAEFCLKCGQRVVDVGDRLAYKTHRRQRHRKK